MGERGGCHGFVCREGEVGKEERKAEGGRQRAQRVSFRTNVRNLLFSITAFCMLRERLVKLRYQASTIRSSRSMVRAALREFRNRLEVVYY